MEITYDCPAMPSLIGLLTFPETPAQTLTAGVNGTGERIMVAAGGDAPALDGSANEQGES